MIPDLRALFSPTRTLAYYNYCERFIKEKQVDKHFNRNSGECKKRRKTWRIA